VADPMHVCMACGEVPLKITDPTATPTFKNSALSRWCSRSLYDPRDEVFVRLSLTSAFAMAVAMVLLFGFFHWALAAAYVVVWGWLTPPVILMLHCTMHRPFIRAPRWLNRAHVYAMSLLFGIPVAYAQHHIGMHHVEDNMPSDLSSTMRYRRDSFLHFLAYVLRFLLAGVADLTAYLLRKRRLAMARRVAFGEVAHLAVIVLVWSISARFALVAFAFPYVAVRFMMMMGNWGQHAFLNTARPNDGLSNAITCINSDYNRRAFNDGYHIGHHLKPNLHWTLLPQNFIDHRESYACADAIVFERVDFFLVSLLLWTRNYRYLAKRFVRLDGKPRSDDDVMRMLESRVKPVLNWAVESTATTPADHRVFPPRPPT
jgi:fatty acid desaturase